MTMLPCLRLLTCDTAHVTTAVWLLLLQGWVCLWQPLGGALQPVPVPALQLPHQRGGLHLCRGCQIPLQVRLQGPWPCTGGRWPGGCCYTWWRYARLATHAGWDQDLPRWPICVGFWGQSPSVWLWSTQGTPQCCSACCALERASDHPVSRGHWCCGRT